MLSVNTTKIIICFILMLVFNTKSIEENKSLLNKNSTLYEDNLYIFIYIFLWNFLIEISLIIIFYFKQVSDYKGNHTFINSTIIVIQLVNNVFFMRRNDLSLSENFLQMEFLLLSFEIIQILLGFILNNKSLSKEILPDFFFYKNIHRIFGILIYFGKKYQIYFYLYYFLLSSNLVVPIIVITFLMTVTISTHILIFFLIKKTEYDLETKGEFLVNKKKNKKIFEELLQKLEFGEADYFQSKISQLRISLMDNNTKSQIEKEISKIPKFAIVENYVYSLENFTHPCGDFIFEAINGKDITREFHGLKSYRFHNKKINFSQNLKFQHSDRTSFYLNKNCIGKISAKNFIENENENNNSLTNSTDSLKLTVLDRSGNNLNTKNKIKNHWSVDTSYNFSKKTALHFIKKCEKDYYINLSSYWLDFFGKYFLLQNGDKKNYMYPILSLSPIYLEKKQEWFSSLKINLKNNQLENQNSDLKEISNMYLVLQQQLDSQQRKLTESENELKTCYLPLACNDAENFSPLIEGQKFTLSEPLGFGLNLKTETTEKYLCLIKNEGIFAFLDFLEFLGQKAFIEMGKTDLVHPVFSQEFLYAYSNSPEFSFYWEISQDFEITAESCGVFQFEQIEIAYKNDPENKISKLVKKINIVKNKKNENGLIRCFSNRNCSDFVDALDIMDHDKNQFSKFIVSGEENFVDKLMKDNHHDSSQFIIL